MERITHFQPDAEVRLDADPTLRAAVVAVAAASPWLGRVCVTDPSALDVLTRLDDPLPPAAVTVGGSPASELARLKRLELLRIAARDLLSLDPLEAVGERLSELAAHLLELAWQAAAAAAGGGGLAVIGMGKLGGRELNYSSDVDLLLVAAEATDSDPRAFLDLARSAWRVDLDLRPEGRAGPPARTLASYLAYWDRWAETWEFQALLKARPVAGDAALGSAFATEAGARVWGRPFGADQLRQVRQLKARAEQTVSRQGLADRELKRGKGGIRDIEFAIQLLQLVHGRADPQLRSPSTLPALAALAAGGYVSPEDAADLEAAYRFLRTVEHRLQLQEGQQVHTLPTLPQARTRLARVARLPGSGVQHGRGPVRSGPQASPEPGPLDPRAIVLPASAGVLHRRRGWPPAVAGGCHRTAAGVRFCRRGPHLPGRPGADPGVLAGIAAHEPHAPVAPGLALAVGRPRPGPPRPAHPGHRHPPAGSAHRPVPGVARSGPPAVPAAGHRAPLCPGVRPTTGPDRGPGHRRGSGRREPGRA